jgi:hydrogenase maturation protease
VSDDVAEGPKARQLLIGIGNLYRRDDGVGLIVARRIQELSPALRVVEATGEGTQLMDAWQSADAVVLVDAVRSGCSPGRVHRLDARMQRIPSDYFNYSTHAFSVAEAVEISRELDSLPASLVIYGIEGKSFAAGTELSPEVAGAVGDVAEQILAELRAAMPSTSAQTQRVFRKQNAERIVAVKVRLGALSHISASHFREHFVQGTRGTKAEGARLDVEVSEDSEDPRAQDILLQSIEVS